MPETDPTYEKGKLELETAQTQPGGLSSYLFPGGESPTLSSQDAVETASRLPLEQAGKAHELLGGKKFAGKVVLICG